jgi:hypothetical protein
MTVHNGPPETPIEAAHRVAEYGFHPVPVKHNSKNPGFDGWPQFRCDTEDIERHFHGFRNVGILLGADHGGAVDVDLDCAESLVVASAFLPPTGLITGREARPYSHRWYVCPDAGPLEVFKFRKGANIVELRSREAGDQKGSQTVVFGRHPDKDGYAWHSWGEPAVVPYAQLLECCRDIAIASVLLRHYPHEGSRHDFALAVSGWLLRARWPAHRVSRIVDTVARAAQDEEAEDRSKCVIYTASKITTPGKVDIWTQKAPKLTGFTRLRQIINHEDCEPLSSFVRLTEEPVQVSPPSPTVEPASESDEDGAISVAELVRRHGRGLRTPVIDGLLREGETMNLISAPKIGKSWLVTDLAIAVATGRPWLDRYHTRKGRVLIVDNELHPQTAADRIPKVAIARGIEASEYHSDVFVRLLRGRLQDFHGFIRWAMTLERGTYRLIVLDAFYRFMPADTDENDNGAMAGIYNMLDRFAEYHGCAIVAIHHTSKGAQDGKSVTDVGSGAGAQSRAADTHMVLRRHEDSDAVVVDAAIRTWPPISPHCLRLRFPVWEPADDLDPEKLASPAKRPAAKPVKPKPETDEVAWTVEGFCANVVPSVWVTRDELVGIGRSYGIGSDRLAELVSDGLASELIARDKEPGGAARFRRSNPDNAK